MVRPSGRLRWMAFSMRGFVVEDFVCVVMEVSIAYWLISIAPQPISPYRIA